MDDNKIIAARLAELRNFSDFSVEETARMLGISVEDYEAYERGEKKIPINLIYTFASKFGTEPSYVTTGKVADENTVCVVYEGKGTKIERYPGYSFIALASEFKNKIMNPMLVDIAAADKAELVRHGGHEFNYVLEGELRVMVGSNEYFLRPGDSIYFNAGEQHAQLAMTEKARFLTVITD